MQESSWKVNSVAMEYLRERITRYSRASFMMEDRRVMVSFVGKNVTIGALCQNTKIEFWKWSTYQFTIIISALLHIRINLDRLRTSVQSSISMSERFTFGQTKRGFWLTEFRVHSISRKWLYWMVIKLFHKKWNKRVESYRLCHDINNWKSDVGRICVLALWCLYVEWLQEDALQ